jgi:hypothetical protein
MEWPVGCSSSSTLSAGAVAPVPAIGTIGRSPKRLARWVHNELPKQSCAAAPPDTPEWGGPSLASAPIDENGVGRAHAVAEGTVRVDNPDGYAYFGAAVKFARCGDCSAAVTTGPGHYWIARECEPIPRAPAASWSADITHIR